MDKAAIYVTLQISLLGVFMKRRRNSIIILMPILLFSFFTMHIFADVPSVKEISAVLNEELDLSFIIKHSSPSSNHFIDKIQVDVDGDIQNFFNLTVQSLTEFNINVTIDVTEANEIQVRAHCTLHGWGTWTILTNNGEEPADETGGIPGYPLESLILGIIIVGLLLGQKQV